MTRTHGRIDSTVWLQHNWRNRAQSLILLVTMGGFLALLGWLQWGADGIWVLLMVGTFGVLFNPAISPRLVMRLYGARPIAPRQAPALWTIVDKLTARAALPRVPDLYYVPSRVLNAFAVGTREHAAIAVTDGLLRKLDLREVAGVLAHELSHIRNNDLWVMGLADMFSRGTNMLSLLGQFLLLLNLPLFLFADASINWFAILLLIIAPTLSALTQLALARTREYSADLNAARLTGDPGGLARALTKIERMQGGWLERIFMPGRRIPEPSLLRTHPQTEERVARLMALKPQRTDWGRELPAEPGSMLAASFGQPIARPPGWHISGLWH